MSALRPFLQFAARSDDIAASLSLIEIPGLDMKTQVHLRARNLSWIDDTPDDPHDLCAHGFIEFSVDSQKLVTFEDGEFTVSAAAIYLLRTLVKDHTPDPSLGTYLFPCCGLPVDVETNGDVVLVGCNCGVDFQIRTIDRKVYIHDRIKNEFCVSRSEWRRAVFSFSQTIWEFYARSSPKQISDPHDGKAFEAFCDEWCRRHPALETLKFGSSV